MLHAERIAEASKTNQKKILIEVGKILPKLSLNCSPPEMARVIYKLVREKTHLEDLLKI